MWYTNLHNKHLAHKSRSYYSYHRMYVISYSRPTLFGLGWLYPLRAGRHKHFPLAVPLGSMRYGTRLGSILDMSGCPGGVPWHDQTWSFAGFAFYLYIPSIGFSDIEVREPTIFCCARFPIPITEFAELIVCRSKLLRPLHFSGSCFHSNHERFKPISMSQWLFPLHLGGELRHLWATISELRAT